MYWYRKYWQFFFFFFFFFFFWGGGGVALLYDDKLTIIQDRSSGPEDFELTRFNPLLHMLFLDHDIIFYFQTSLKKIRKIEVKFLILLELLWKMEHLLNMSKCSIFHNIFKYMIFPKRQKALLWGKGLKGNSKKTFTAADAVVSKVVPLVSWIVYDLKLTALSPSVRMSVHQNVSQPFRVPCAITSKTIRRHIGNGQKARSPLLYI